MCCCSELDYSRRPGDGHQDSATDGRDEECHPQRNGSLQSKEADLDVILILQDEDNKKHQHYERGSDRNPHHSCPGHPSAFDVRPNTRRS